MSGFQAAFDAAFTGGAPDAAWTPSFDTAFVDPSPGGILVPVARREVRPALSPAPIFGLIQQVPVNEGIVQVTTTRFVRNSADVVAEGAEKPESEIERLDRLVQLETHAHYVPTTTWGLEDDGPWLEANLRTGLMLSLEKSAVRELDSLGTREALDEYEATGLLLEAGVVPTALVCSVDMYRRLDPTHQLVPVLVSPALRKGGYLADWSSVAAFLRPVQVHRTRDHADDLIRNRALIMAEVRAAIAATDETAVVRIGEYGGSGPFNRDHRREFEVG